MYKAIIAASIAVLTAAEEAKFDDTAAEDAKFDDIDADETEVDVEVLSLGELLAKNQEESYSLMDQQEALSLSQVDLMNALFD